METILSGNVLWASALELQQRNQVDDLVYQVTGVKPFHSHTGEIQLTESTIEIIGDHKLLIRLAELTELYLGFDENYTAGLVKNFGLFWQPLRLTLNDNNKIYLIIAYNFISAKNKHWFDMLQELLS